MTNYQPLEGFYDLRNFDLTEKEFASCYRIQKYLCWVQIKANYIRKHNLKQWQEAQRLSTQLQQFLLPKLKAGAEL